MTVAELIAELERLPPELPVVVQHISEIDGDRYVSDPSVERATITVWNTSSVSDGAEVAIIE